MADTISQGVVEMVAVEEQERQRRIALAWEAYYGTNDLPLSVGEDAVDDNVRLNYAKLIVNKGVTWLFGADRGLAFGITSPTADTADEKAQDALDSLWPQEERAVALHQMGVNGGVSGHVFVRLMRPATEGAPPRVIVLDPSNMTVLWDQEDFNRVLEFRYTWTAIDPLTQDPYARRQRTCRAQDAETGAYLEDAWVIVDERAAKDSTEWVETGREDWQYPWPPIFHCQNLPAPNEFYGASDLEPEVLDLLVAVEAVAGYARKLTRHRGHPLPYVVGERPDRIEKLNVALGRLLVIPDAAAKVGQLEAMSLDAVLDLYRELKTALYEVSRVPATAWGSTMSNIAEETVELSFAPAVEKTWDKRLTYGPMLTSLTSRILEIGGYPDRRPAPVWTDPIPRSAKSEAEALERDLRMGIVSKQTAARKRGYDWDQEEGRLADEKATSNSQDPLNNPFIPQG